VDAALGGRGGCRVGIADGTFAAGLAARHQAIVPPGAGAGFLAPFPVATLERPDLADLLVRLGLRTLGDLAALPRTDLAARFGPEGARAHRLASGLDEWPRAARRPPPDLRVVAELDPPAERVDVAAFAAKALADQLVARLERLGLACTRLRVEAETEHGETLVRVWRHDLAAGPPRPAGGPAGRRHGRAGPLAARRLARRGRRQPSHRRAHPPGAGARRGRSRPGTPARVLGRADRGRRAGREGARPHPGAARRRGGPHRPPARRPRPGRPGDLRRSRRP
jgi:hypothetical protein